MPACSTCGADLPDEARTCHVCGSDREPTTVEGDPEGDGSDGTAGTAGTAGTVRSTGAPGGGAPDATDDGPGSRGGFEPGGSDDATGPIVADADYDPEAERERFQRRYGIDLGDRTVDEFLAHLDRQDYSATPWFWLVVGAELAGVTLFGLALFANTTLGLDARVSFVAVSALLGVGIVGDTRTVGQFRRWARIRWTYVLIAAIPLVGHLSGLLYLLLRRLMHEQTVEHRRRLLDAGFDVGPVDAGDD